VRVSDDDIVCPDATVKRGRPTVRTAASSTDGSGDAGLGVGVVPSQTPGMALILLGPSCFFGIAREIWASSREIGT
jgi:hypothetical protein